MQIRSDLPPREIPAGVLEGLHLRKKRPGLPTRIILMSAPAAWEWFPEDISAGRPLL